MSAARHTSKIRTRVEANEQKIQQPGRIVNALPLLSANGCSANYTQLNYVIRCPCNTFIRPTLNSSPIIFNTNTGTRYAPLNVINGVYYFRFTASANITIENSRVRNAVVVGPGGNIPGIFGNGGRAGQIVVSTVENGSYSIFFDTSTLIRGVAIAEGGSSMPAGTPTSTAGPDNLIGRGLGGSAGISIFSSSTYIDAYSGSGYGAGGGGQTSLVFTGGGGEGGFNPDLYFGVNGLNSGMPTSTITTNGSPGVVIFALQ
jgi:hypothetical protein